MKQLYCFLRLKAVIWIIFVFCLLVAGFVTFLAEQKRHGAQREAITQQGLARDDGGFGGAKPLPLDYENRLSPRQEKESGKTSAKPPVIQ
jgi:hypothetical protein